MGYAFKKNQTGFTLIELMIVVAIVGILAVLAIYGVRRYVANAKTAEARNNLGEISKDAIASYDRESMPPGVLDPGGAATASRHVCASATNLVPTTIPLASKYQSSPAEWSTGVATATTVAFGWSCLRFSIDSPQYYQYGYTAVANTAAGATDSFTADANGNLNGDTVTSNFELKGQATAGVMRAAPTITEVNPEE